MGFLAIATIFTLMAGVPAWAEKKNGAGITPLAEEEAAMLTYMREEEKLAHDVYVFMYETWSAKIFDQITDSEQKHMDTMLKKLFKYGLPDPALDEGEFTNAFLQGKYNELIALGDNSYVAGLDVGATIEEIDMVDIQHAIDITSHVDVVNSYEHLLEGSKNHLRAYVGALETQGVTYVPKLISQELFDAIMEL
jgi:hypothetical protein